MRAVLKTSILSLACCLLTAQAALGAVVDGNRIMDQDMGENLCALTFDDGPSVHTPELLDMLAGYGVKATFFLLGKNAQYYPEITRRIVREGHEVGNHSWSHPNLKKMSTDAQQWQIERTDEVLRAFGAAPVYMRPPYGAYDERTQKIAEKLGVSLILWSMDSYDWKRLPENYARIPSTRGTVYEDGALRGIFLFHDIHKTTVDDLPRIIDNLRAGGCQKFVTVSEYLEGILDPEPPALMARTMVRDPKPVESPGYAMTRERARLARCSLPDGAVSLNLEDARAAFAQPETVH
ncbi:MAG: polysaccharide deacetylase family protein [Desulfovibrio sp.]|nr:polysaccharide deacetylase family protein [Desulfovibrio sp.]